MRSQAAHSGETSTIEAAVVNEDSDRIVATPESLAATPNTVVDTKALRKSWYESNGLGKAASVGAFGRLLGRGTSALEALNTAIDDLIKKAVSEGSGAKKARRVVREFVPDFEFSRAKEDGAYRIEVIAKVREVARNDGIG